MIAQNRAVEYSQNYVARQKSCEVHFVRHRCLTGAEQGYIVPAGRLLRREKTRVKGAGETPAVHKENDGVTCTDTGT